MIGRPFDEAEIYGSFDLRRWKEKAAKAHERAVANRSQLQNHTFQSEIWSQLKPFLLAHFFDKCAYCELKITPGFWGDVEHYRPKKKVAEEPNHPGYYWLAYEPSNLMPSCQRCNQGKGKMNHFPVVSGTRAYDAKHIAAEQPLLLTPYFDAPLKHLSFEFDFETGEPTGYVKGKTPQGRTSVSIYNLNREELVDERLRAQRETLTSWEAVWFAFKTAQIQALGGASVEGPGRFIAKIREGGLGFAAARIGALKAWTEWDEAKRRSVLGLT
jgi:hypothetical protein